MHPSEANKLCDYTLRMVLCLTVEKRDDWHIVKINFVHSVHFEMKLTDEDLMDTATDLRKVFKKYGLDIGFIPVNFHEDIKEYRDKVFPPEAASAHLPKSVTVNYLAGGQRVLKNPTATDLISLGMDLQRDVGTENAKQKFIPMSTKDGDWAYQLCCDAPANTRLTYRLVTNFLDRTYTDIRDIPEEYRNSIREYLPTIEDLKRAARGEMMIPPTILAPGISVMYGIVE